MSKRTPRYSYKIRKVTKGKNCSDSSALTVPEIVEKQFQDVQFFLTTTPTSIIYESGCKVKK